MPGLRPSPERPGIWQMVWLCWALQTRLAGGSSRCRGHSSCKNSDFMGRTVSNKSKNGLHESTASGWTPETLSAGIKRTAGSHPKERVSGGQPAIRHILEQSNVHQPTPIATYSALSAAYAAPGWLPAVRFIPCAAYAADKAWPGRDCSESANPCVTRLTSPVRLSPSYYS